MAKRTSWHTDGNQPTDYPDQEQDMVRYFVLRYYPERGYDVSIEPCIKAGTSERGARPKCGAPWRQVTERGENTGKNGRYDASETTLRNDAAKHSGRIGETPVHTVGWQPSCTCGREETMPCVVLDPFGGSGTVAKVARDLGRSSISCELNPEYVEIAKKRLRIGEQLDSGVCEYEVRSLLRGE